MWNYEEFSSHVRLGWELIYEINNIFFSRAARRGGGRDRREESVREEDEEARAEGRAGGKGRGERRRRYGEGRGTRGETHKAAYVSSVMRTGDFSFRARECKRKMKARSFFSRREGEGGCRCVLVPPPWFPQVASPPPPETLILRLLISHTVGSAVLRKSTRSCI